MLDWLWGICRDLLIGAVRHGDCYLIWRYLLMSVMVPWIVICHIRVLRMVVHCLGVVWSWLPLRDKFIHWTVCLAGFLIGSSSTFVTWMFMGWLLRAHAPAWSPWRLFP